MKLFGIELKKLLGGNKDSIKKESDPVSFAPPKALDDTIEILSSLGTAGGYVQYLTDLNGTASSTSGLINQYRKISAYPDVEQAITDIVDQSIIVDDNDNYPVNLKLDNADYTKNIKDKIYEEWYNILDLFNNAGPMEDLFKEWYVDGRQYYHVIIDENKPKEGIKELRLLDSVNVRRVREVSKEIDPKLGIEIKKIVNEYFIYNDMQSYTSEIHIAKEALLHASSGLKDENYNRTVSHLHKAIKYANNLRQMEDALVVYRMSRAAERRIFYIDTGNLPKGKAEQYITNMMAKFRNKITYNAETGEIETEKRHMSIMEDFWIPRQEGRTATEIDTLPAAENLSELDDVLYFQRKLYRSLNIPISRLDSESGFSLGRSSEIERDEVKYQKFIKKLRKKFGQLFFQALKIQLVLKGIISEEEWKDFYNQVTIVFEEDNYFSELKNNEILKERLDMLDSLDNHIGKYYSKKWIRSNILRQTEDEQTEMDKQIEEEKENLGNDIDNDFN